MTWLLLLTACDRGVTLSSPSTAVAPSTPLAPLDSGLESAHSGAPPLTDSAPIEPDPTSPLEGTWSATCTHASGDDTLPNLRLDLELHEADGDVQGRARVRYDQESVYGGGTGTGGGAATTVVVPVDVVLAARGDWDGAHLALGFRVGGAVAPLALDADGPADGVLAATFLDLYEGGSYTCALALTP